MDVLKILSKTKWGADRLWFAQSWTMDTGLLDTVHHQWIRLACGAYRTLPIQSQYEEANELSLEIRCLKLALQYVNKWGKSSLFSSFSIQRSIILKAKLHPPIWSMQYNPSGESESGFKHFGTDTYFFPLNSSMGSQKAQIHLDLERNLKSKTHPNGYHQQFLDIKAMFPQHIPISHII